MSDLGNKQIMADNIRYYMHQKQIDRRELCEALGFKYSTVTDWLNAEKYPRIDKIEMMANYFDVSKADLVEQHSENKQGYYLDEETAAIANALKEGDGMLRVMFDTVRKLPPEKMKEAANYIAYLKAKQHPEEEE